MDIRQKLEELLSGLHFDGSYQKYIWGAGNTAVLYQEGLNRLDDFSIEAYIDTNVEKQGQLFCGKRVISPDEIENPENSLVLICSPQKQVVSQVKAILSQLNIKGCHIDEYIFGTNKAKVLKCFDLFSDDKSKEIYYHIVKCRIEGRYPEEKYVNLNQYFCKEKFLRLNKSEVFVDCGAYVGDTIEKFIWAKYGVFKKIIAFEPDIRNYKAMQCRVNRLKNEWALKDESIELYPYAISNTEDGQEKSCCAVRQDGLGTRIVAGGEGESACNMIALDQFVSEEITFIKADIESYEYKMLLGARHCVEKYTPLLAISIYHNAVDFFSIPLLVHNFCPEYRMAIQHHSYELYDTVLYAWKE